MPIFALLTFIFTLTMNYLAGMGYFGGVTVGDISDRYPTLITPASYTFSIWGLIYLGLLGYTVYQFRGLWNDKRETKAMRAVRFLFIDSNVVNGLWILMWINDEIALSLVMICLLFALLIVILIMLPGKSLSKSQQWFVHIPFQLYAGWITVALVANFAVYISKNDIQGLWLSNTALAVTILCLTALFYMVMLKKRKMPSFGYAGSWALLGIAVQQWEQTGAVGITAAILSLALAVISTLSIFK